jgi:hypothetical protein
VGAELTRPVRDGSVLVRVFRQMHRYHQMRKSELAARAIESQLMATHLEKWVDPNPIGGLTGPVDASETPPASENGHGAESGRRRRSFRSPKTVRLFIVPT